jgi:DNA-binding CsgD family transcriptional regulator
MALVHAAVIGAALSQLALQGAPDGSAVPMWIAIMLGLSLLRVMTTGSALATSTLALEPIGMALFLAGTGGPTSPFFTLALAGIWWASHTADSEPSHVYRLDRTAKQLRLRLAGVIEAAPSRGGLLVYVVSLVVAYLILVGAGAARGGGIADTIEQILVMFGIAALSRASTNQVAPPRTGVSPSPVIRLGAEHLVIRDGLARALPTMDVPLDAVIAAGEVGLTAQQAELLAYLLLGLTNQEIADAIQVSEATVRYRLTRLYRTLGVVGRRRASARARELGLTVTPRTAGPRARRSGT